jgi:hypothetical protein
LFNEHPRRDDDVGSSRQEVSHCDAESRFADTRRCYKRETFAQQHSARPNALERPKVKTEISAEELFKRLFVIVEVADPPVVLQIAPFSEQVA